jgi:two-component system LytT family sensor kinase
MKIRWREHEQLLVSLSTAILIGKYVYDIFRLPEIKLDYLTSVLAPQIASVMLIWLCYFWLNRIVIPGIVAGKRLLLKIPLALLQVLLIAYLLGPVLNFISFYLNVAYQPQGPKLPLTFGFHPQPFLNAFGGMDIALIILTGYLIYAAVREKAILYLQHPKRNNSLAIVVTNETTLFLLRLFTLPIFASIFGLISDSVYYNLYFAYLLPIQAVFITNKFFLFPLKGDRPFFTWYFAGPLTFSSFLYTVFFSPTLGEHWSFVHISLIWALQLFFVTPISWLDYKQSRDQVLSLRGIEKELLRSKADLQLLRMQINPHFLFNILNTIYGTALIEGANRTAESTQKLGEMMRFMIHENTMDYIPLDKEISYLRNYIDLQKLRIQLSADIEVEDQIDYSSSGFEIVPMLLIPFVENAFKHGIDLEEQSFIRIHLRIENEVLNYEVSNSMHKLRAADLEKDNSGIGLRSVKKRLQLFYPGRYELYCAAEGNVFNAKLSINLKLTMNKE